MEPGHHQFQGADPFAGVYVHGDAAAVILHPDNIVPFQNDKNFIAVALSRGGIDSHSFIYGVVYYLKYQMMEAVDAGGTDVHTGALPYGLKTFKNLNLLG
jgi:hypothetical protein